MPSRRFPSYCLHHHSLFRIRPPLNLSLILMYVSRTKKTFVTSTKNVAIHLKMFSLRPQKSPSLHAYRRDIAHCRTHSSPVAIASPRTYSQTAKEKVYITLSPMRGGLHNPQPMKRSVSPTELFKTCQITLESSFEKL